MPATGHGHEQKGPPSPDLGLRAELWNSASEDQLLERLGPPASPPHPHSGPAALAGPGHLQVMPPAPPGPPSTRGPSSLHMPRRLHSLVPGVPILLSHPATAVTTGSLPAFPDLSPVPVSALRPAPALGTTLLIRFKYGNIIQAWLLRDPNQVRHRHGAKNKHRAAHVLWLLLPTAGSASAGLPQESSCCPRPRPPHQTPGRVPAPGARQGTAVGFQQPCCLNAGLIA